MYLINKRRVKIRAKKLCILIEKPLTRIEGEEKNFKKKILKFVFTFFIRRHITIIINNGREMVVYIYGRIK